MGNRKLIFWLGSFVLFPVSPSSAQVADFTYAKRFDGVGRLTGTITPKPNTNGSLRYLALRNTYDISGRLAKIEKGSLATWQGVEVSPENWVGFEVIERRYIDYDAIGRKIVEKVFGKSDLYSVTQFSYNAAGLADCTAVRINPTGYPLAAPDACKQIVSSIKNQDQISKTEYNEAGQVMKIWQGVDTPAEQITAQYKYSNVGQRIAVVDANGNRAEIQYDGYGRQVKWKFPQSSLPNNGTASTEDYIEYGYDANDNRVSVRKRDGKMIKFEFDALNRVVSKIVPSDSGSRSVFYNYNMRSMQLSACFDSSEGSDCVRDVYDGFGHLISSTTALGSSFSQTLKYRYDKNGNRIEVKFPDLRNITYKYDNIDRLIGVVTADGNTIVGQYDYSGNLTNVDLVGASVAYKYDDNNRVSGIESNETGMHNSLKYNGLGQIVSVYSDKPGLIYSNHINTNRSYTSNGLNQYTDSGDFDFKYDANGNLTKVFVDGSVVESFLYDIDNRLIEKKSTTHGAAAANIFYDPVGRIWSLRNFAGVSSYFLNDSNKIVAEYNNNMNIARRYVYGLKRNSPTVWYEGNELSDRRTLIANIQGSVASIKSNSGAVYVNSYDEFGVPSKSNQGMFQFTGYAWLESMGLYYSQSRIYSPTLGRFLQVDPAGYTDQINLYSYVGNDPVNNVDPTGLYTCAAHSTPSQCRVADLFVEGVKAAAARRTASAEVKSLADALGEKGKGGPVIDFDALKPGTLGEQSGSKITLDIDQINSQANVIANTFGITSYEALHKLGAGVVAHETKHFQDDKLFGPIASDLVKAEKRAYRVQDQVEHLLNLRGNKLGLGMSPYDYEHDVKRRAIRSCIGSLVSQGRDGTSAQAACINAI